jgi:hypothetical protein
MFKMRSVRLAVAAAVALILGSIAIPTSAYANDTSCPHGGNLNSAACYYGVVQTGVYTVFQNSPLYITTAVVNAGGHINQGIWTYSGSPCSYWVEEGVGIGVHQYTGYSNYYARYNSSAGYYEAITGATANSSLHSYELL